MDSVAKVMVFVGVALTLAGALVWAASRAGLGRLPGDILIERGGVHVSIPIVTSIVVSLALTVALNVVVRVWR
jgi:hypothetical protein